MSTGFVWHERFMWHDTGSAAAFLPSGGFVEPDRHVESPESKRRLRNLLEVSGLLGELVPLVPRAATREELLGHHTPEYIDWLVSASADRGGDAAQPDFGDPIEQPAWTPFGPGGLQIAELAAGGCMVAVDAVLDGRVDNAYALVRPPGHHALPSRGMGSCLLANVVLAVQHGRRRGIERVAVVDWDAHHGNGSEHAFWENGEVLTISVHQDRCFPSNSGGLEDVGDGAGRGANINVPLPPGSGDGAYLAALERVIEPAIRAHRSEMVIVACGLDASVMDPNARMMVTSTGFRGLARGVLDVAAEVCDGRVVMCHEGGYSTAYVPFCGLAVIEELAGRRSEAEDPFLDGWSSIGGQELQPHQRRVIDAVPAVRGL